MITQPRDFQTCISFEILSLSKSSICRINQRGSALVRIGNQSYIGLFYSIFQNSRVQAAFQLNLHILRLSRVVSGLSKVTQLIKEINNSASCVSSINQSTELRRDPHSESIQNGMEDQLLPADGTRTLTYKRIGGYWVHKGWGGRGHTCLHTHTHACTHTQTIIKIKLLMHPQCEAHIFYKGKIPSV